MTNSTKEPEMKMANLDKLRRIAQNMDKSINVANVYGDKKHAEELSKAQLVLLKLSQHLLNSSFDANNIKNLESDIAGALE